MERVFAALFSVLLALAPRNLRAAIARIETRALSMETKFLK